MSFLKKIKVRSKSTVQIPEDTIRAQMKEEKKLKRSSVHGLSGFRSRQDKPLSEDTQIAETTGNGQDGIPRFSSDVRQSRSQSARDRERKKHKDMSGIVAPVSGPANEYPTFLVHYLGRIPTHAEYGRDAVEKPVEQLCKLREKQKLSRLMVHFDPDGLKCWEVSGPFLKVKKDGFSMSVPLHHITYGVGSNDHPDIFACIIRMNVDPIPGEDQMLMLHAFICAKAEVTQKLTYWQLQAYIEAYEDLKRKRILRDRRRQAMGGSTSETSVPAPTFTPVPEEVPPGDQDRNITEVKIKGKGKVKVKTPVMPAEDLQNGPSKAVGLVLQDGSQIPSESVPVNTNSLEENDPSDVFVEASGSATGTVVHRARIVSRSRTGSSTSDTGNPSPSAASKKTRSREGSSSSAEGEAGKVDSSFQKRIAELQGFMDLDADMLKKLMVTEHPTLARRICYRASVDPEGVFHQEKMEIAEGQSSEQDTNDV